MKKEKEIKAWAMTYEDTGNLYSDTYRRFGIYERKKDTKTSNLKVVPVQITINKLKGRGQT